MAAPRRGSGGGAPPRVALVHALAESLAPLDDALDRLWPEAVRMHLLDASLSRDLSASPAGLDDTFHARFRALGAYAVSTGTEGVLFSCSAFGPCIAGVAAGLAPLPVHPPNTAMVAEALALGGRVGLVATFAPTLPSVTGELPAGVAWATALAPGALEALRAGDAAGHDARVAAAAATLVGDGCTVVALAQVSMARAAPAVAARCGVPVLTTVDSAVRGMRRAVEARRAARGG
jgi:hypothetical protein